MKILIVILSLFCASGAKADLKINPNSRTNTNFSASWKDCKDRLGEDRDLHLGLEDQKDESDSSSSTKSASIPEEESTTTVN